MTRLARTLKQELQNHLDLQDWWLDDRRPHPRLYVQLNGHTRFVVLPGTSSDHRASLNTRSDLRRILNQLRGKI